MIRTGAGLESLGRKRVAASSSPNERRRTVSLCACIQRPQKKLGRCQVPRNRTCNDPTICAGSFGPQGAVLSSEWTFPGLQFAKADCGGAFRAAARALSAVFGLPGLVSMYSLAEWPPWHFSCCPLVVDPYCSIPSQANRLWQPNHGVATHEP